MSEESIEQSSDQWLVHGGDYGNLPIVALEFTSGFGSETELTVEKFIANTLRVRMGQRRQEVANGATNIPPIIALDFGATEGYSFVRLAQQFRHEIENDELIIVCSNLKGREDHNYEPQEHTREFPDSEHETVVPGYDKDKELVRFVTGKSVEILKTKVKDHNGTEWDLLNNVALVNESFVLQHIKNENELAETIADLNSLLDGKGLFISTDLPKQYASEVSVLLRGSKLEFIIKDNTLVKDFEKGIRDKVKERAEKLFKKYDSPKGREVLASMEYTPEEIEEIIKEKTSNIKKVLDYIVTL